MSTPLVALIDVGKTNTRLSFIDPHAGVEVWNARRANAVVHSTIGRELDIVAIERWLLGALQNAPHKKRVNVIVPIAHGAAAVLVDRNGKVLVAPDYEDPCYESVSLAYESERDRYERSFSPSLPLGLNLGRQLFFVQVEQPQLFAKAAHLLLYPQYWAWRFSGVMASEMTSLGCHSDLWRPQERSFSALARARNWTRLLPEMRFAGDLLGPLSAEMIAATGLDRQCKVACGMHDSNASYLKFLIGTRRDEPFTVISSGTWTVVMANHADLTKLREGQDMLANVDAFGSPVATARFMGGREYEAIAGVNDQGSPAPDSNSLMSVLHQRSVALPSFARGGPFAGSEGRLLRADRLTGPERAALATLYMALMSEILIESLDAGGDVLVDGPLAANPLFGSLLAACLPASNVRLNTGTDGGGCSAAAYLAGFISTPPPQLEDARPLEMPTFNAYRHAWRELLPPGQVALPAQDILSMR